MTHLLLLTWNGAGNQPPAIGLAQELAARGHEVTAAGYWSQRDRFRRAGTGFRLLRGADAAYPTRPPPEGWLPALIDAVWACPRHREDVAEILADGGYDAVIVDCLMFGALAVLETASVPVAVLVHSAPGPLAGPGGGMERLLLEPVNAVRAAAGRPPVERLWDAWEPFPTLCASIAELDPQAQRVPSSFVYTGPVFERQAPSEWHLPRPVGDLRPLVLASFSTGPLRSQVSRIQRTLDALADGNRVLVTLAGADASAITVPGDAMLLPWLPHAEVLPEAALTVTHAGHGTVSASLAHGVPVLSLPNPAADQPVLAQQVARLGAGLALDGEEATVAEIRAAAGAILADLAYSSSAQRIAKIISTYGGVSVAATEVERLIT